MKLYQLICEGTDMMNEQPYKRLRSKILYPSQEEAEDNKDKFIERCTTPESERDICYLIKVDTCQIIELELPGNWVNLSGSNVNKWITSMEVVDDEA